MPTNLVDKLSHNPVWQETIKLYSGLLNKTERSAFILDLGQHDILLASECKTISVKKEPKLKKGLIVEAERKVLDLDAQVSARGMLSLVELKTVDAVHDLLIKIKKPTKEHKDAIDMVVRNVAPEKVVDIFNVLIRLDMMKQSVFLHWGIDSFVATVSEKDNKYSDDIIREVLILILNTKRADLILKLVDLIDTYDSGSLLSNKTIEFVNDFLIDHISFSAEEFTGKYSIKQMCDKLRKFDLTILADTVENLNMLLIYPGLYEKFLGKRGNTPSRSLIKLKHVYDKKATIADLKKLNRVALEEFFLKQTPKHFLKISKDSTLICILHIVKKTKIDMAAYFEKILGKWYAGFNSPKIEEEKGGRKKKRYNLSRYHWQDNPKVELGKGDFFAKVAK